MTSAQQLCWNKYLFSGSDMCWKFQQRYVDRQDTPTPGSRSFCLANQKCLPGQTQTSQVRSTHHSLEALCRRWTREGSVVSVLTDLPVSSERWQIRVQKGNWWAHRTQWKDPRTADSVLNLKSVVEFGRTERTFQVEKCIFEKMQEVYKKENTSWPHGEVRKTNWVLKSLDTNRWAVRLF